MFSRVGQQVRKHRRTWIARYAARLANGYLEYWYNQSYWNFDDNGEAFVIGCLRAWSRDRPLLVWDVGAHLGEWAIEAHAQLPMARIVSFEIVPALADGLRRITAGQDWITVENYGLSDRAGTVEVSVSKTHDTANAIDPRRGSVYFENAERVSCAVTTGDDYRAHGATPHVLKIDTEGHEAAVLRGCSAMLAGSDAPVLIQFEYGATYIPSGSTLFSIHAQLAEMGYAIGRLFPQHVEFKAYDFGDDDFRGGNMIAVRDDGLKALLAGKDR